MTTPERYTTPGGVEAAIKEAARQATRDEPSVSISERIRQEHFRRFLSRVFAEGERSEWLLKGGTGVLARVPSARATKDVDLFRAGYTLDESVDDLQRLVSADLGDHFRFELVSQIPSLAGPEQPYVDGYTLTFRVYIGAQPRGEVKVDLASGAGVTDEVSVIQPANALPLPRLISAPYRVYPVVDQIADKICATHALYSGLRSSRQKDLVDLVVFTCTHDIHGYALRIAIETEARRRGLSPLQRVDLPPMWGPEYSRSARHIPYCADFTDIDAARALMEKFFEPALRGQADNFVWNHERLEWTH